MEPPEWPGAYAPQPYSSPDERLDEGRIEFRRGPRARGPKNWQRPDSRIREDVSERVMHAAHVDSSEVTVSVRNGTVTLEGTVPERWMKYALENLAATVWGVDDVDNRIRVPRNSS
jgi:osmotically-inducible protein OsmY